MRFYFRKGKKNEKKPIVEEKKLYLDPELLQHPILKKDVVQVICKPPFIDEKEWIATHSKSVSFTCKSEHKFSFKQIFELWRT